jgi:hypothetical protein
MIFSVTMSSSPGIACGVWVAALARHPAVLQVLPLPLDGVDDHGAGVMMDRHLPGGGCPEQRNGLAADGVELEILDEHLLAVRRERDPGDLVVVDAGGFYLFEQHGAAPGIPWYRAIVDTRAAGRADLDGI